MKFLVGFRGKTTSNPPDRLRVVANKPVTAVCAQKKSGVFFLSHTPEFNLKQVRLLFCFCSRRAKTLLSADSVKGDKSTVRTNALSVNQKKKKKERITLVSRQWC